MPTRVASTRAPARGRKWREIAWSDRSAGQSVPSCHSWSWVLVREDDPAAAVRAEVALRGVDDVAQRRGDGRRVDQAAGLAGERHLDAGEAQHLVRGGAGAVHDDVGAKLLAGGRLDADDAVALAQDAGDAGWPGGSWRRSGGRLRAARRSARPSRRTPRWGCGRPRGRARRRSGPAQAASRPRARAARSGSPRLPGARRRLGGCPGPSGLPPSACRRPGGASRSDRSRCQAHPPGWRARPCWRGSDRSRRGASS